MSENQIIDDNVYTEIISHKFINTPQGVSLEGQILTGKKLIFEGVVNLNFVFKCLKGNKRCNFNQKLFFNHFIVVPIEICDENEVTIKCLVEDITYCQIECGKMIISVTLFAEYVNERPERERK
jgi:hypothetical protein